MTIHDYSPLMLACDRAKVEELERENERLRALVNEYEQEQVYGRFEDQPAAILTENQLDFWEWNRQFLVE